MKTTLKALIIMFLIFMAFYFFILFPYELDYFLGNIECFMLDSQGNIEEKL